MQKKVMAVAVATALAAPVAALAQGSSVQIYGALSTSFEVAQAKGADTNTVDAASNYSSIRGGNTGGGYVAAVCSPATPQTGCVAQPNVNEPARTRTTGSGSNFGLRGREDLGNGLYMGFQAEAAITIGASVATSGGGPSGSFATWRNSGLWLGGRWGEVGLGVWDSPFTVNTNTLGAGHAPYANASTTFAAGLLGGGTASSSGTISAQDVTQSCGQNFGRSAAQATGDCVAWATSFNRRVTNSLWYQSPNWAGFSGRVQYGTSSGGTGNATNDNSNFPSSVKPSLWSVGLNYTLGGLYAGLGFEYHNNYITAATRSLYTGNAGNFTAPAAGRCALGFDLGGNPNVTLAGLSAQNATIACIPVGSSTTNGISGDHSTGWNVNLRYTFGFGLSIGGYYEWIKWNMDYNNNPGGTIALGDGDLQNLRRNAYRLDAAYQLGAHTFGLQYAHAGDMRGQVSGAANGFNASSTGVNGWILGYAYSLSKRSSVFAYGTLINNDTNARFSGIVFNGIGPAAGGDPRYIGAGFRHLF